MHKQKQRILLSKKYEKERDVKDWERKKGED
jgi:hypothetical protein